MWPRVLVVLITAFFIVMNALLWHWELGGGSDLGSPVSARSVWERVLTAPDSSSLEILHHGKIVGHCRWVPAINEAQSVGRVMSDEPPEGMVRRPLNYVLDLNGSIRLDATQFVRFTADLKLSTNYAWQEFAVRINRKPNEWTLRSSAVEEKLRFSVDDEAGRYERHFTFDELRNPEKILREFGGPMLTVTLAAFGLGLPGAESMQNLSLGLTWEAHQDRLVIGNAKIRCYRLRARLFDRFQVVLYVSSIGEILRAELPDQVVLRNEALNSLYKLQQ